MQFAPGNVVRSTAGRDKNHLYVVVSLAAGRVLVADGQRRTIRKLKPTPCTWNWSAAENP